MEQGLNLKMHGPAVNLIPVLFCTLIILAIYFIAFYLYERFNINQLDYHGNYNLPLTPNRRNYNRIIRALNDSIWNYEVFMKLFEDEKCWSVNKPIASKEKIVLIGDDTIITGNNMTIVISYFKDWKYRGIKGVKLLFADIELFAWTVEGAVTFAGNRKSADEIPNEVLRHIARQFKPLLRPHESKIKKILITLKRRLIHWLSRKMSVRRENRRLLNTLSRSSERRGTTC